MSETIDLNSVSLDAVRDDAGLRSRWLNEVRQVRIWSGQRGAWWRQGSCGYTDVASNAGIWSPEIALKQTRKLGSHKAIRFDAANTGDEGSFCAFAEAQDAARVLGLDSPGVVAMLTDRFKSTYDRGFADGDALRADFEKRFPILAGPGAAARKDTVALLKSARFLSQHADHLERVHGVEEAAGACGEIRALSKELFWMTDPRRQA